MVAKERTLVTIEDGTQAVFLKLEYGMRCQMYLKTACFENDVVPDSIQMEEGKPLQYSYYYGYQQIDTFVSEAPVKSVEHV